MSMAIVGVAGGVVAAGSAAYGASQAGGQQAPGLRANALKMAQLRDQFGGRNYRQDYQDAMRYGGLNSLMAGYGLFGNAAGSQTIQGGGYVNGKWRDKSYNIQTPEQEGLLSLIGRAQPQLDALQRGGDPQGYALLDSLTQDAAGMVGGYDPYEDRLTQQSLRGAQSARGMGYGNSDAFNELLGLEMNRQDRRQRAGQYAGGVLGVRRAYMGDPTQQAAQYLGAGQGLLGGPVQQSNIFNPQAAQVQQQAWAANLSNQNSSLNNIAALGAGAAQMGMSYYNNAPNPHYGTPPGQVPYNYSGDPSSPYRYR